VPLNVTDAPGSVWPLSAPFTTPVTFTWANPIAEISNSRHVK